MDDITIETTLKTKPVVSNVFFWFLTSYEQQCGRGHMSELCQKSHFPVLTSYLAVHQTLYKAEEFAFLLFRLYFLI